MTVATMMPLAVRRKPLSRSHVTAAVSRTVGRWYGGRSITSASLPTLRHSVLRSARPTSTTKTMLMT